MQFFNHKATLLSLLLLISLAVSTTHDTVFDLLSMAQSDHTEEERTANSCQGDAECDGCLCVCHIFAESPQLDSSNPTQPLVTYLTTLNTINCYSIIPETLERPPKYSQV